jgi:hypothetical protein
MALLWGQATALGDSWLYYLSRYWLDLRSQRHTLLLGPDSVVVLEWTPE